ncbi:MAG: hypothetical protein ACYSU7_11030 [Planctomycetota bacterium]
MTRALRTVAGLLATVVVLAAIVKFQTPRAAEAGGVAGGNGPCPADIDGSGSVDVLDFLQMLGAWGPCSGCPEDIDGDGTVGITDFLQLLADWGACPTALQIQLQTIRTQIELYNEQNPGDPYDAWGAPSCCGGPGLANFWDALVQGDYLPAEPINPLTPNPEFNDPTDVAAAPAPGGAWVWMEASPGDSWTLNLYAVTEDGHLYSDPDTGDPY